MALAVVLGWLFLRQADAERVLEALRSAHPGWVTLAVGLTFVSMWVRSWRWRARLLPVARPPLMSMFQCLLMGWSVSVFLPGRLGEVVRPLALARRTGISGSAAIATVVLERVFDAFAVLLLLAAYLVFFPAPTRLTGDGAAVLGLLRTTGLLALLVVVAGLVLVWIAVRSPAVSGRILETADRLLPVRVAGWVRSFVAGLGGLKRPHMAAVIIVQSILLWSVIVALYVALFVAMDIDVPWFAALPLVALVVVGVLVPTPAAVGSFHKAAQIGLASLWAVANDPAVAYAILSHAVAMFPTGLVGLGLLVREGFGWAEIRELDRDRTTATPAPEL